MTDYMDGTGIQYHLHIKKGDVGRCRRKPVGQIP